MAGNAVRKLTRPTAAATRCHWAAALAFVVGVVGALATQAHADEFERPWWWAQPAEQAVATWPDGESIWRFQSRDDDDDESEEDDDEGPDITEPGPDFGDFPNSAFTLPKGRIYLELAPLTLLSAGHTNPSTYSFPYLLRYGVTNDLEFRLTGFGLTSTGGDEGTTGFSPLIFNLKVHFWDDRKDWWLPAAALELFLQTEWASPAFRSGAQPALAMNFDLPLTERLNFEWTIGYGGVREAVDVVVGQQVVQPGNIVVPVTRPANLSAYQFSLQWAFEYEVNDKLELFIHGYHNGAVILQQGSGDVVGGGGFWTCSKRLMLFGSCNAGLNHNVPPVSGLIGFAVAL